MGGFKDYVKNRLDRRYSQIGDVDALRQEIADFEQSAAGEFERLRRDLMALKSHPQREKSLPESLPPTGPDDHSIRLDIFRAVLRPMKPARLLDLGTGHGKFARAAHDLGWEVTAVDARTDRMPNTHGIEWVHSDLRDFEIEGYDVIAMLGIFYHLEVDDQLALLQRCAGTTTIIDTHIALEATVVESGYEGSLFSEKTDALTASWTNRTSFWPTEDALVRMLHNCGYRFVFRLTPLPMSLNRTWYLCY